MSVTAEQNNAAVESLLAKRTIPVVVRKHKGYGHLIIALENPDDERRIKLGSEYELRLVRKEGV